MSEQMLRIKVSDSDMWLVEIKPGETKIEVNGTAEAAYLRAGLTVRFEGEIDKKGNLQAEVSELELFTPQGKNGLGLFVDDSPTAKPVPKAPPGKYDVRTRSSNSRITKSPSPPVRRRFLEPLPRSRRSRSSPTTSATSTRETRSRSPDITCPPTRRLP